MKTEPSCRPRIELTRDPIDYGLLVESSRNHASGAAVLFLGTVREMSEGRAVDGLSYEAYPSMAHRELSRIADEGAARWDLTGVAVTHRLGRLDLGEVAVAVVATSAHRAPAFEAARWIMEEIKRSVPIWKRERWSDGTTDWVHPE